MSETIFTTELSTDSGLKTGAGVPTLLTSKETKLYKNKRHIIVIHKRVSRRVKVMIIGYIVHSKLNEDRFRPEKSRNNNKSFKTENGTSRGKWT